MHYVSWTCNDITGLDVSALLTEIDEAGFVLREIGLDEKGSVVHKCPSSEFKLGERGYFDLAKVATLNLESDIKQETFQELWGL